MTAMITPFDEEGGLDLDGAVELAKWLVQHGTEALVVSGTTGESPTLRDEEKLELWRAVSEAVTVPVVAGSGSNDTAHSVELTKAAKGAGAAAILAVAPYYNRPSQAGLREHFRAVAEATSLPVYVYDIPVRTGRAVAHETLLWLAREVPNVVGLKDAAGNPAATARLIGAAPASFDVYSGDDAMTLPLLAVGAVGVIGVATHWAGEIFAQMIGSFLAGELDQAILLNQSLLDSYAYESSDDAPNPVPVKYLMGLLGLPAGPLRLPLGPYPAELKARAEGVLAGLGLRPGQFALRGEAGSAGLESGSQGGPGSARSASLAPTAGSMSSGG